MSDLVGKIQDILRGELSAGTEAIEGERNAAEQIAGLVIAEFERGKDVGRAIGWEAAKRDTSTSLGLNGDQQRAPCPWCKEVHEGTCSRLISGGQSD